MSRAEPKLRPVEKAVLEALARRDGAVPVPELAASLSLDQSPVAGAVAVLAEAGLAELSEETTETLKLGAKGSEWNEKGAPERAVARALAAAGGRATVQELAGAGGLEQKVVGQSIRWLGARAWGSKGKEGLSISEAWQGGEPDLQADELLVQRLAAEEGALAPAELEAEGIDVAAALELLSKRSGVVQTVERTVRSAEATDEGRSVVASGIETAAEETELTTDLLVSGRWRDVDFRPYDVGLEGPRALRGKIHPFRRILEETRQAYLLMGFEEIASPWVESGFWDFDALFQPQDHPARDMQDTFYVGRPEKARLPSEELVQAVERTHEDGGDTGSTGWRYDWNRDLAERCVLRTHTTSATIRALSKDPRAPRKVFCVGPVFRRETIDYKHLPVFHQVDGIVVAEDASFASLLGLLRLFYERMGFDKIQFRPAFFPYTEPSVEVFVWLESRKDWVEMGGAGVFREEVTAPLGCEVPVLAWGLGLERLAMFRYRLGDIRELYMAHLSWLEGTSSCR